MVGGPRDTGDTMTTGVTEQNIQKPSPYPTIMTLVSNEYRNDEFFVSCETERVNACIKAHVTETFVVTGPFVDQMNLLLQKNLQNEQLDNCVSDSVSACSDMAIKNKMQKTPSEDGCRSYIDPAIRKNCYDDLYPKLALQNDDIRLCDKLTDIFHVNGCQDAYNTHKAVKTKDISWCMRLSVDYAQENCKRSFALGVALDSGDVTSCTKYSDPPVVPECVKNFITQKVFTLDASNCKKIDDYASYFANKTDLESLYIDCAAQATSTRLMELVRDGMKNTAKIDEFRAICNDLTNTKAKTICLRSLDDAIAVAQKNTNPAPATPKTP